MQNIEKIIKSYTKDIKDFEKILKVKNFLIIYIGK